METEDVFAGYPEQNRELLYEKFLTHDDCIFELEQNFRRVRRVVVDDGRVVWKKAPGEPIMNEIGILDISSIVRDFLSRNNTITNYDEDRINIIIREFMYDLNDLLLLNCLKYELNPVYFEYIQDKVGIMAESALRRSLKRSEARDLLGQNKTATILNESSGEAQQRQASSIFPTR